MASHPVLANDNVARLNALPAGYSTRWVAARKLQVVEAVESGLLRLDEALQRYRLSLEEFEGWQKARRLAGASGLRLKAHARVLGFGRKGVARRPRPAPHLV
ncbi:MAG TPA: DUF1153 domain-containing protein [Novosphingobium sp.]|nr:DUF1153 domain-containing protein [Novosphingobium sp.]